MQTGMGLSASMRARRIRPRFFGCLFIYAAALAGSAPVLAQQVPQTPFAERWQDIANTRSRVEAPRPAAPAAALPVSLEQALYLIRSTLLTLNDANRSGNYTVLRDLAAPGFQAKNSAADLALIFSDLRRRNVDLYAVALLAPQLARPPALEANGMLRLSGHFPTRPLQINFDLLFQNVDNHWRLFGVSVATPKAPAQANLPPAPSR
jgi:hypothetical protein